MSGERRPYFLVSVDAEGDDVWGRAGRPSTRNAGFLPRFQALCERYGVRPTWLVDYEMAACPAFRAFGRDVLARGAGEIGAHLHPWDSPPPLDLTGDDGRHLPYCTEYPDGALEAKLRYLVALLAETFGARPVTFRAGRWGFDGRLASHLVRQGFQVDCTVTPGVDWRACPGVPGGTGGPDYRGFPESPYFLDPEDIARPGGSPLLEVPMTVRTAGGPLARALRARLPRRSLGRRILNRFVDEESWLRPMGGAPDRLARLVRACAAEGRFHVQYMIHSSELMPGGHPDLPDAAAVDRLYAETEAAFAEAAARCRPILHKELRDAVVAGGVALPHPPVRYPESR